MNNRGTYIGWRTLPLLLLGLLPLQGPAQEPGATERLQLKFNRYIGQLPWEDIYVHSDRLEYVAGEELWIKVTAVDRRTGRPSAMSRIACVELLNDGNRPVAQLRIRLDAGCGNGQVTLPDTLSSGTYVLRAYTSWMRNFLPDYGFMREIRIYNALDMTGKASKTVFAPHPAATAVSVPGAALKAIIRKGTAVQMEVITGTSLRKGSPQALLGVRHGNTFRILAPVSLNADTVRVAVPEGLLVPGMNQVVLFSGSGTFLAETAIAIKVDAGTRREEVGIAVERRGTVVWDAGENIPEGLCYSISVAPAAVAADAGMETFLAFGSEFGLQPSQEQLFQEQDTVELPVTSGWIRWQEVTEDRLPELPWPAETESHILTGRLTLDDRAVPAGRYVLMCVPGKEAQFRYAVTDSRGLFRFTLPVDEAEHDLVFLPDSLTPQTKITFESAFSDRVPRWYPVEPAWRLPSYAVKLSVNYQVQSIYRLQLTGARIPPVETAPLPHRFYGRPDIELRMDEYIKLPVMEEVFYELLPNVSLKKKKDAVAVAITNRDISGLVVTTPAVMVDGVMLKDPSLIAGIDPELVEKIDVVKEKYVTGDYRFPGIVNVITKTGDFSVVDLPAGMVRMNYRVTDPVRRFPLPEYNTADQRNSRVPDYRNTLFWDPGLSLFGHDRQAVTFPAGDNRGDYLLRLEGISADGQVVSRKVRISVK
jgi:hypothetical protein